MKYIHNQKRLYRYIKPAIYLINKIFLWEEIEMLKMLSKLAEKYAKSANTACYMFVIFHQPKMPASLIKKD